MPEYLSALFYMNGYGVYVWSAYGVCTILLAGLLYTSIREFKKLSRALEDEKDKNNEQD